MVDKNKIDWDGGLRQPRGAWIKKESAVDNKEKIDGAGKNAPQLRPVFAVKSSSAVLLLLES